jgi:hypothetical protein
MEEWEKDEETYQKYLKEANRVYALAKAHPLTPVHVSPDLAAFMGAFEDPAAQSLLMEEIARAMEENEQND